MNRLFYAIVLSIFLLPSVAKTQIVVNFGSGSANPGQTVDVDITLDDFDDIVLMQFSINWDSTVYVFNDILNVTTTLPEFTEGGNIGDPSAPAVDEGQLTVSWNLISTEPESLPDGHRLFTLRLEAVGTPCDESTIDVSDDPRNIEVIDGDFNSIGLVSNPGLIEIPGTNCNGSEPCGFGDENGVGIIGEELNTESGQNVCVSVSVENFNNIESAQSGIIWNTNVAQYTGVENFGLPGLSGSLFNDNNVANGELRFLWFDNTGETPQTLPDGSVIFDVCFDVIGGDGSSTFIEFVDLPNFDVEFSSGGNVQPFFTDCGQITVGGDPPGTNFTLIAGTGNDTIPMGGNGCIDFTVRNFDNIQSMQFNVMWDPAIMTYSNAAMFNNLPFLSESNFNLNEPGKLRFSWNTLGEGITLDDNTVIFQLCYDGVGECDATTDIMFVNDPPINIEISDADNNVVSPVDLITGNALIGCDMSIMITLASINMPDCTGEASGGVNVTVSGGDGSYTCTWFNGNNGSFDPGSNPAQGPSTTNCNAFGQTAGEYCLLVEDGSGTTASECFTIDDPDPLEVSGVVTHEVNGDDGAILLDIDGAQGNTNIVWTGGLSGSNPTGVSKGDYSVTVTDENSCSDTESFEVNPPALGVTNAVVENSDCEGSGSVNITVFGGCKPLSFLWEGPNNESATFEDVFGIKDGEWCVTITDSDNPPTQITQCYIVGLDIDPLTILDSQVSAVECNGEDSGSLSLTVTGGCPDFSYSWTGPNAQTFNTEDIDNLIAGEYCVTITDSFDPMNEVTECFNITQPNAIFINEDNIIPSNGNDGAIMVTSGGGTGDLTFDWLNIGGNNDSEDLDNLEPGNYTLCATDENDCEKCVDFVVPWAQVIPNIDDPGQYNGFGVSCTGECDGVISGTVDGNEPIQVFLDGSPETLPITGLCAGTYTLSFTDNLNLMASVEIDIIEPEALSITLDSLLTACSNGDDGVVGVVVNGGVGSFDYQWNIAGSGPVLTSLPTGIYGVVVTDDNDCQVMLQNIEVDDCIDAPCFDARTVLTPNGDGLNEELFINCSDDNPSDLEVYDRWGKRVYVQSNYDNTWNGVNLAGNELPEGAYMWVLKVTLDTGQRQIFNGAVTILRDQF